LEQKMNHFSRIIYLRKGLAENGRQSLPFLKADKKGRLFFRTVGYTLIVLTLLLTGCNTFAQNQEDKPADNSPAGDDEISVLERSTPESPPAAGTASNVAVERDSLPISQTNDEPVLKNEPEIGKITFALDATDEYEPIDPGFLFAEGVTEVHAIFEYRGMSPNYTWERVWYLNEKEISRSSGLWTGYETGSFDYFIDNGGKPLPAGDWILELYVEGKLCSLGVFIIEAN
jgi:hypothetical protein